MFCKQFYLQGSGHASYLLVGSEETGEALVSQLQHCIEDDEYAREQGYDPDKVELLFMSLT